jgi:hypothetical protein
MGLRRIAPATHVDSPWLEDIPPRKRFLFQQNLEMEWPINADAAQPRWGVRPVYFTTVGVTVTLFFLEQQGHCLAQPPVCAEN